MICLYRQSKGFTLIEVMIALVILAAGILALTTMQIVAVRSNAFSGEMTYTAALAQEKIEELMNLPPNSTKVQVGDHPTAAEASDPSDHWYRGTDSRGINYNIEHTILNNTPIDGTRRASLTVRWTGSAVGQPTVEHSATFTAFFRM